MNESDSDSERGSGFVADLIKEYAAPLEGSFDESDFNEGENYPLTDADDNEILMHRDVHFGGDFALMLEYYEAEEKGAVLDRRRIQALAELEERLGHNLAPLSLSGAEAESVGRAKHLYSALRDLYEQQRLSPTSKERLLADLILSELDEEDDAVEACVKGGAAIVPELITLLNASEFTNPLLPGYGFAPSLAARALGRLKDERAVIPLFEAIGQGELDTEEEAIAALRLIGDKARDFLVRQLNGRFLTQDTETAALVLSTFREELEISKAALRCLEETHALSRSPLSFYLAAACAALHSPRDRASLKALGERPEAPALTREQISEVVAQWGSERSALGKQVDTLPSAAEESPEE